MARAFDHSRRSICTKGRGANGEICTGVSSLQALAHLELEQ